MSTPRANRWEHPRNWPEGVDRELVCHWNSRGLEGPPCMREALWKSPEKYRAWSWRACDEHRIRGTLGDVKIEKEES